MRYAVATPARNEEDNLRRLGAALAAQTHAPVAWVVVDDGSTDGTAAVVAELAAAHPWVRTLTRDSADPDEPLADGRRRARDLDAFLRGARAVTEPVDVIVKVDADVDFEPDYFERLIAHFEQDETLAIASGTCYEQEDGDWVRRTKAESTVWGATRAYRYENLADVEALEPCMGWDGLDEIRVQLRGLRTQAFVDLPFRHHRPEGGRELTSLHQGEALGRASWYMGYRPSYLALRALYRARREPAALAMLWGYTAAAARRAPRCPDPDVVRVLRDRQRLRATLLRGAPAS
ncbi:MAG TPA: glycosyltransferase [Solirubrobacteraceae bacterium]|nr:glycosyltransferase [Solirubrobacteraceae bacterium]